MRVNTNGVGVGSLIMYSLLDAGFLREEKKGGGGGGG